PTVREADGLAMSSRNVRLSGEDRNRAPALHRALNVIKETIDAGETDAAAAVAIGRTELRDAGIEPEYLAVVDPETFEPRPVLDAAGPALVIIAALVGSVRLIDNEFVQGAV
ncbi:MAG TPA: pantoate--beta-alanine ligase, partial [Microlunatus sp.]